MVYLFQMGKYWKLVLLATFLLVIILLNYTGFFSILNINFINQHHDYILSYIQVNFYRASILFILLYIVTVIFSFTVYIALFIGMFENKEICFL